MSFPCPRHSAASIGTVPQCVSIKKQSGVSLLEALVSLLLIAVMAAGLAMVSSRSLLTQRYVITQNLAVMQMREHMKTKDPAVDTGLVVDLGPSVGVTDPVWVDYPVKDPSQVTIKIGFMDESSADESSADVADAVFGRSISIDSENLVGGAISIGTQ